MLKKFGWAIAALVVIVAVILFYSSGRFNLQQEVTEQQSCPVFPSRTVERTPLPIAPLYAKKNFNLAQKIKGLSEKQLDEHNTLYEGYVQKRNEIAQKLTEVDLSNQNKTYSAYRALKIAETYALNGSLLHELYFENMSNSGSAVGPQMLQLIEKSFGSFEQFKNDLMAAALCSHGWVLSAYSIDDHLIHNYVLEAHNQTVPVLALPLLVLDVYEHAYMIDFGIKRAAYLDVFFTQIDWNVVEERINRWVNPLNK